MSVEPAETLVERVRRGFPPGYSGRAIAALTELVERLRAAERERQWLLDREKHHESAAEARVAELEQQLLNAREAPGGPQDKRVAELEERLRGAGNAQDLAHFKYAELQARVAALEEALRAAQALQPNRVQWFRDNGIVFHRAPLNEPPEEDGERWEQIAFSIYTDLCEVESIARAALRVEGDA